VRTSSCSCAKSTRSSRQGRTEQNVVGSPMFPVFMAKTTGFLFIVGGITALLGAFAQVNPIWQFGPYDAARISYAVQPDWYMGFLDGALRIWPSWSFHSWGHTIPFEVLIPAVVLPGLIFNLVFVWPIIERKFTTTTRFTTCSIARVTDPSAPPPVSRCSVSSACSHREFDRRAREVLQRVAQ